MLYIRLILLLYSQKKKNLVLAAPVAVTQKVLVDVTIGTAMGDREYAGTPRDGFRQEPGWRGVFGGG